MACLTRETGERGRRRDEGRGYHVIVTGTGRPDDDEDDDEQQQQQHA